METPVRTVVLHGSLTSADFIPGRSDVDVLVVVEDRLTGVDVDALETTITRAALDAGVTVDLHVVTADVAAAPPPAPRLELHVSARPATELGVEADPDLLAELSMARAHGRRLVGAEPGEVIGHVPPGWVRERGVYWVTVWKSRADDRQHAELMVLTACRIWRFALDGVHTSKTQAGRWALTRDGSLTAVREALHRRTVDPSAPIGVAGVRQVLDTVHREIA